MELLCFDEDFLRGFPYVRNGFFLDRLLEADPGEKRVTCEMETTKTFPLVAEQRNHPVLHPPHLPGGVILHLTGMVGFVAARILLGIRFDEGWSGYGSRVHRAEFKRLVRLGPPVRLEGRITSDRRRGNMAIVRYEFRFTQESLLFYFGDQTAVYRHLGSGLLPDT
ncbi:MAG: hypothetical protein AB1640_24240 [bacterium]